jgi:hypothetical protein
MARKHFIAVDLEDFHSKKKVWQGTRADLGGENFVHIHMVGGKNLNQARAIAHEIDPKKAWYVFPLDTWRNRVDPA